MVELFSVLLSVMIIMEEVQMPALWARDVAHLGKGSPIHRVSHGELQFVFFFLPFLEVPWTCFAGLARDSCQSCSEASCCEVHDGQISDRGGSQCNVDGSRK